VINPIRMTAHKISGALDFNEIDAEDKFVDAPSYDALAAELAIFKAMHARIVTETADAIAKERGFTAETKGDALHDGQALCRTCWSVWDTGDSGTGYLPCPTCSQANRSAVK
jgi:hypothetical protein